MLSILPALLLCAWRVACKYGFISRFKGIFSAVWGCCVGLCCLGALRGLCGFCVREWLGGLKTFCVFAFLFSPFVSVFALLLCSLPALLWLSSCLVLSCLFLCPCGFLCFLFPFRTIRKKKGRAVLVRPLLSCCRLLYLYSVSLSSVCQYS